MDKELLKEIEKFNKTVKECEDREQVALEVQPYQSKRRRNQDVVKEEDEQKDKSEEGRESKEKKQNKEESSDEEESEDEILVDVSHFELKNGDSMNEDSKRILQSVQLEENDVQKEEEEVKKEDSGDSLLNEIKEKLKKGNKHLITKYKPVAQQKKYYDPLKKLDAEKRKEVMRNLSAPIMHRVASDVTPEEAARSQEHTRRKMIERMCGRDWRQNR